jgi:glycerophosphoryl diester phosphodiesterase
VAGIELDAHLTRDGVPVVCHDPCLRRLAGVNRRIATLSWREIQAIRLAGSASIPRLADVLRLARGRAVVQIEIKPGVLVSAGFAAYLHDPMNELFLAGAKTAAAART